VSGATAPISPPSQGLDRGWTDSVGAGERDHRDDLDDERREQRRPPADVVGDRPDDQKGDQQRDRVDRKDAGQRDRRKAPLGLVDRVERRGDRRREQEGAEDGGEGPEGDLGWQSWH